jgi:hypothetical protein
MATTLTMGRGTNPLYTVSFTGISADDIADIYVTFEQSKSNQELTKHFPDIELTEGKFYVRLSQQETLAFAKGSGKVQIRILDDEGVALKTDIWNMKVSDVLYEEVI